MQPGDLNANSFAKYPPLARAVAVEHLAVFKEMPLSLLPLFLRELQNYDYCFPAERQNITSQIEYLSGLSVESKTAALAGFAAVRLPESLAQMDWVNQPQIFTEKLTAMLWATHGIDAYHSAAEHFQASMEAAQPHRGSGPPRLVVVIVGQSAKRDPESLFQKLRPHGCLFTAIDPAGGVAGVLNHLRKRASQYPSRYAHWYIDGGPPEPGYAAKEGIASTSYASMAPIARKEMMEVDGFVHASQNRTIGAEEVRTYMAGLGAQNLGMESVEPDPVMRHFNASVLTQGSGTQIFSTTFVQWASRECLRRAQPLSLVARYAPRQQSASLNQLLARDPLRQPTDPEGSLIDAEMGAYYTWLNLQRLSASGQDHFLAWYEDHSVALAISPLLPRRTISRVPTNLGKIFGWL